MRILISTVAALFVAGISINRADVSSVPTVTNNALGVIEGESLKPVPHPHWLVEAA